MEQEIEIEKHLEEQKQQLEVVVEALKQDPEEGELLELQSELVASIEEFEKALLETKKARLLEEIQDAHQQHTAATNNLFQPGQICRFKHQNMKWYTCRVEEVRNNGQYAVKALYPTSNAMLQIFAIDVSNLVEANDPQKQQQVLVEVGSIVFALNYSTQLWEKAEVNIVDYSTGKIQVVYSKNGRRKWLDKNKVRENLIQEGTKTSDGKQNPNSHNNQSEFEGSGESEDQDQDDEEFSTEDVSGDENDEQEENNDSGQNDAEFHGGLGSVRFGSFKCLDINSALDNSLQQDQSNIGDSVENNRQLFADWEKHGKGIASKLMNQMGYEFGKGLGAKKQGRLEPVNAIMLPKNKGLGVAKAKEQGKRKVKRRARGGERARRNKRRLAAQALDDEEIDRVLEMEKETGQVGVFAILDAAMAKHNNNQSILSSEIDLKRKDTEQSQYFGQGNSRNFVPDDRQTLIATQDKVGRLKSELVKLQQIAEKNINQKEIYNDIIKQIGRVKMQINKAEKDVASVEKAVNNKEKRQEAFRF